MTEAEWEACLDPQEMLPQLLEAGERKLRLLACACVRRVWHLLPEGPSRESVEVGEAWADGRATRQELDAAFDAAVDSGVSLAGDPALSEAAAEAAQGAADVFPDYGAALRAAGLAAREGRGNEGGADLARLLRCVFGPLPFRGVAFDPAWRTPAVVALAEAAYQERLLPSGELDPQHLAVLADALEEVGAGEELLAHLRGPAPHVRGCFAVDAALGRG
jgi:hypothetical protein